MGQEQTKAQGAPGTPAPRTPSDALAAEAARMRHVVTPAEAERQRHANLHVHEREAERMLRQLEELPAVPPLVHCTVDSSGTGSARDRTLAELAAGPAAAPDRRHLGVVPHDGLVRSAASLQTISCREGVIAVKRQEEVARRMNVLSSALLHGKSTLSHQMTALTAISVMMSDAEQVQAELDTLGFAVDDVAALLMQVDDALTASEREEIREVATSLTPPPSAKELQRHSETRFDADHAAH